LTRLVAREDFAKTLRCAASNVKLQGDYKQWFETNVDKVINRLF
jgi:hypothetical protein